MWKAQNRNMSIQTHFNCSGFFNESSTQDVAPNPDISGIGVWLPSFRPLFQCYGITDDSKVLVGFLVTAYLTFLLVIVYYITGCVEENFINQVDRMVLAQIPVRRYLGSIRRVKVTLGRAVLIFSDQQAVTGIALLGSGFAQLNGGIESYHWQVLVYLAWFSSLTHLTTLTILRQYFRDNHVARFWRCIVMLITVIMLGVAILPTGDGLWFTSAFTSDFSDPVLSPSVPAVCFFKRIASSEPHKRFDSKSLATYSMIISLFVLVSGYVVRLVKLSTRATDFSTNWIMTKPSRILHSMRSHVLQCIKRSVPNLSKLHWILGYLVIETSYVLLAASLDIYTSMLWEVCSIPCSTSIVLHDVVDSRFFNIKILWLAFALAWGTGNLFSTRLHDTDKTQNTWSFGQIFPVILLVLPLLSLVETFYGEEANPTLRSFE